VKYRLSSVADEDIEEIWLYIARDNPSAADALIDVFHEKFQLLAHRPQIGLSCESLRPGMRRFHVNRYIVYYQLRSSHIEIVRILHGARDIESLFLKMEEE